MQDICESTVEDLFRGLLGCDTTWYCCRIPTFRTTLLPPSLFFCNTLKMEAAVSSETLVSYREDLGLNLHRCRYSTCRMLRMKEQRDLDKIKE
jgi:hypothetical protein